MSVAVTPIKDLRPARSGPRRRWLLAVLALVVVGGSIGGGLAYRHHHRFKHFAVHEPGRVYRSAWVEGDVFEEVIRREGIKTVVNLCQIGEMGRQRRLDQRRAVEAAGATLVELPFPLNDTWHVDDDAVREAERILDDPASYPLWIHCQHGRERTVKVLAMYDIRERGLTAQESLAQMPLYGMPHPWPVVTFAFNYETQERDAARQVQRPAPAARR